MIPKDLLREYECLGKWCILSGYRGSIAHGMYVPNKDPHSIDDKDAMAICVPPVEYYYGLREFGSRGTKEISRDPWDIVCYEARKFVRLLKIGNPNVLSLLWLPEKHYMSIRKAGQLLIDHRDVFVARHVYRSFVGYAKGQLHRMTHWKFEGYMGEKRKRLVEKISYDCKNAAHLIRLLRMGIEFLRDGKLYVDRGGMDATELLDIKRGEWPLQKVKDEADRLFANAEAAYQNTSLPIEPDRDKVNALCVGVIRAAQAELH